MRTKPKFNDGQIDLCINRKEQGNCLERCLKERTTRYEYDMKEK